MFLGDLLNCPGKCLNALVVQLKDVYIIAKSYAEKIVFCIKSREILIKTTNSAIL